VELVDRAEQLGIVRRSPDADDRRVVRVRLTQAGESKLETITRANFEELDRLAPQLTRLLGRLALDG
jgi:DNA-binding MarR family transcriptional regulator